jgi:hypothetical protein
MQLLRKSLRTSVSVATIVSTGVVCNLAHRAIETSLSLSSFLFSRMLTHLMSDRELSVLAADL